MYGDDSATWQTGAHPAGVPGGLYVQEQHLAAALALQKLRNESRKLLKINKRLFISDETNPTAHGTMAAPAKPPRVGLDW
jgi:hypothetical protein